MLRVLFAIFVSAAAAVAVVALAAAVAVPLVGDVNPRGIVALHFAVFGAVIAFPIAFLGGLPLYYFFRWRGWLRPGVVLAGGVALALAFPVYAWWINSPGVVSFWHFFACATAGAAASMVFIRLSGVVRS